MTLKFFAAAAIAGFVGGFVTLADRRADYWRPVIERIAAEAGSGPIKSVRVLPFKGCGWSFGETIYAKLTIAGYPADLLMCRTRQGVRVDITTYESHWVRGVKAERPDA